MARVKTWEISEGFWSLVEPLVPKHERDPNKVYKRKQGAVRKPASVRLVFEAIVYVLRNGVIWNAITKERFGVCSSTVHRVFQEWCEAGFFDALWEAGLTRYDELKGIEWEWQSADGCITKAPLAQEAVGPSPTDRGKKWDQAAHVSGPAWRPYLNYRDRSQSTRQRKTGRASL